MKSEFAWRALDADGRFISGVIDADDPLRVDADLRAQGLSPISIESRQTPPGKAGGLPGRWPGASKRSSRALAVVCGEFGALLRAGVQADAALEILSAAHQGDAYGTAIEGARRLLREGRPLSEALREMLGPAPAWAMPMIRAGERVGDVGSALASISQRMEDDLNARDEAKTALVYPGILVLAGVAAVVFIFAIVVPRFATAFKSRSAELPWLTRVIFDGGMLIRDNWPAVVALIAGLATASILAWRRPAVRTGVVAAAMNWPLVGPWLRHRETAAWTELLATLLAQRVGLLDAVALAAEASLPATRARLELALREIRGGRLVSEAIRAAAVLPPSELSLLTVGERSGDVPRMLLAIAERRRMAARIALKRVVAAIEPAAILLIGAVIGTIVASIMFALSSISVSVR